MQPFVLDKRRKTLSEAQGVREPRVLSTSLISYVGVWDDCSLLPPFVELVVLQYSPVNAPHRVDFFYFRLRLCKILCGARDACSTILDNNHCDHRVGSTCRRSYSAPVFFQRHLSVDLLLILVYEPSSP